MTILHEKSRLVIIPASSLLEFTINVEYENENTLKISIKENAKVDKNYTLLKLGRDYSITIVNKDGRIVRISKITLQKAITSTGEILVDRILPITQTWDSDYVASEHPIVRETLFDESRMIEQQLKTGVDDLLSKYEYIKVNMPSYNLLDPKGKVYGQIIITDGKDSYEYYPFKLENPTSAPDKSILTIDNTTKELKFVEYTGINNPIIPIPSSELKHLVAENNIYKLSPSYEHLNSTDTNVVYVFNGTSFIKKDASVLNNPIIPTPTATGTVLKFSGSHITWGDETKELPRTTLPTDENKILQVDSNGKPKWGVKISPQSAGTVETKNAVFKDGELIPSDAVFAEFYGFRKEHGDLILYSGEGDYNTKDFDEWAILPSGLLFSIDQNGDFIITIPKRN